MESKKAYIMRALKIYVSIFLLLIIIFLVPGVLLGNFADWIFLGVYPIILSLIGAYKYRETEVKIPIKDKHIFLDDFKNRIENGLWNVSHEKNDEITVKPRFDRFYSWLCKAEVRVIVAEDYAILSGAKMYTDKMQSTLEGKALLRDKRGIRYLGNVIVALILLLAILINYQIIDTFELRKTYHEFRVRNIEKIQFEENLTLGNTVNHINNQGMVVEADDYVYYVKGSEGIYKADADFNHEEPVLRKSGGSTIWYLNVSEDWIFYRDGRAIKRMKLDGSKKSTLFNLGYVLDIHLLDNWLYFIYLEGGFKVYKTSVNGEDLQRVVDVSVSDIAIYDNKLYYSYTLDELNYLKYLDLSTGVHHKVANLYVNDMVLEDNLIYYIDYHNRRLYEYDLLTKIPRALTDDKITQFFTSEEWIYFIEDGKDGNFTENKLYRISRDDDEKELLREGWYRHSLQIVGDWIFNESTYEFTRLSSFP